MNLLNSLHPQVNFECTKCGACCREDSILVTLTGRDLNHISMGLGLNTNELIQAVDFYITDDSISLDGLRDFPALNTEKGPAYIALKKMENGDCIFLKENQCMIHAIRPVVCMSFPFVFQDEGEHRKWGLSAMKHICPGLGSGPKVMESELIKLANTVLEALFLFREFANEWNKNDEVTAEKLLDTIISDSRFSI
ncbi:MAG: YkgJ family cysteine cluster protein [Candidatus Thorarchaeota archaeon]